jgi:glycosyltransferase involved in cell wall biosynthesis
MKVSNLARSSAKKVFDLLPTPAKYYLIGCWRTPPAYEFLSLSDKKALSREVRECVVDLSRHRPGPTIWFLPTHGWASSAFQRPQQLARSFAEIGSTVLYFEQWLPNQGLALPGAISPKGKLREISPGLHAVRCPEPVTASLIRDYAPDALMMFWPEQALALPGNLAHGSRAMSANTKIIYEVIDDLSLVPDADDAWHAAHKRWLFEADVVTASADDLLDKVGRLRADALLVPNGVHLDDWRFAPSSEGEALPPDMELPRRARVTVGYYGAIASWFDWPLWEEAARLRPDWAFVLIGYPYDGQESDILQRTRRLANMYYLGRKAYRDLPRYLHYFDVATIPFVLNAITHACSPVKLFEYLAAGKPVVSTPMREIMKYSSVLRAGAASEFVLQIEMALTKQNDPEYRAILAREAQQNTWQSRAQKLVQAIQRSQAH